MNCPKCNCDLKEYGISVEAINHYKYDDTQNLFIVEDASLLPYDDSKIICGKCNEEINIKLLDLNADFVI